MSGEVANRRDDETQPRQRQYRAGGAFARAMQSGAELGFFVAIVLLLAVAEDPSVLRAEGAPLARAVEAPEAEPPEENPLVAEPRTLEVKGEPEAPSMRLDGNPVTLGGLTSLDPAVPVRLEVGTGTPFEVVQPVMVSLARAGVEVLVREPASGGAVDD